MHSLTSPGPERLARLKAFLHDAGEVEVVFPKQENNAARYLRRFLVQVAVPVAVGATLASSAPVAAAASAGHVSATQQAVSEVKSILGGVRSISSRYLAHGRTPGAVTVQAISPDFQPQKGPFAKITRSGCTIEGIRLDYSKVDRIMSRMTATPELRAFVLIHEHTHCRTSPSLIGRFQSPQGKDLADNFKEASADAMAILMIARRDGVPAALETLQTVNAVRLIGSVHDPLHDTTATLRNIELVLKRQPERFRSDASAFETALIESARGTAQFHHLRRQSGQAAALSMEESARFAEALRQAAEAYRSGLADSSDVALRAMGFHSTHTPSRPAAADAATIDPGKVRLAAETALFNMAPKEAKPVALAQMPSATARIRAVYETRRFHGEGPGDENSSAPTDSPSEPTEDTSAAPGM